MTVVFPYCSKEIEQVRELFQWIKELDPRMPGHRAILLAAAPVPQDTTEELVSSLRNTFGSVTAIRQNTPSETGWPTASNAMFRVAARYMEQSAVDAGPWFWCEPDCIPVKSGWLDLIESEYMKGGKPFMGCKYQHPYNHINGCMVYPKRNTYNRAILGVNGKPWDLIAPEITLRNAHVTRLIQRSLSEPLTNTPHTFSHEADLSVIWPEAVVFHGCKDGSLIEVLRWRNKVVHTPPAKPKGLSVASNTIKGLLRGGSSFYHSGNYGDIIYALYSIKLLGGGSLTIGPEQYKTSPCSHPIRRTQYDTFGPLVAEQPYISSVSFADKHPGKLISYDMNTFRNNWNDPRLRKKTGIHNLARMHAHTVGVEHLFDESEIWLTVKEPIYHGMICVHRSHRYRVRDFHWREVLERYGKRMLFVGLEREYVDFCNEFGTKLSYWKVKDLLELARLIAGAKAFVGNQSFPCSVAIGLGMTTLQETWYPESADCMFNRPNFFNQRNTLEDFEACL